MRTLSTIAIIAVLLLGGSYVSYRTIETTTQALTEEFNSVEQLIRTQNWESSQEKLDDIRQQWENSKVWLTILLDHEEIDTIDISMQRLSKFIETKNNSLSLGEVSTLELLVSQISSSQQLTLRNIL